MSSVLALEIGAAGVTFETELSGITSLPTSVFLSFMLPIHLAIGAVEGIATGAVLCFVAKYRPETLFAGTAAGQSSGSSRKVVMAFLGGTLIFATLFTWIASSFPDGLEWSVAKVSGATDLPSVTAPTAIMPDYNSGMAGIVGALIVMVMLWAVTTVIFHRRHAVSQPSETDRK